MNVRKFLGRLESGERLLADALVLVSDRHSQDPEIRDTARTVAQWSAQHIDEIRRLEKRFGSWPTEQPDRLRAAMFHDPRIGALGLLEDLHDLALLAYEVHLLWLSLWQAGQALRDTELIEACERLGHETDRQIAWLRSQIKLRSAQTLAVPATTAGQLRSSVPKEPSVAAMPDVVWGPIATFGVLALVGLVGVLVKLPVLLPSLGPSVFLIAVDSAHPTSRPYNTVAGHLIALLVGFATVAALGAWDAPVALQDGGITLVRVAAAAIACAVTLAISIPLHASHPPAAATALLVALGAIDRRPEVIGLAVGAVAVALLGIAARALREGRHRRTTVLNRRAAQATT